MYWESLPRAWEASVQRKGLRIFWMSTDIPVLMDTTGDIFMGYGVFSYPTTFMIDKDGNVFGYASGQLSEDMMKSIIKQTMEGKRS